jgi:Fic family protein
MLIQHRSPVQVESHPWISFKLDLGRLQPGHWVQLGECSSKIQHIIGTPLLPSLAVHLDIVYVSKGVHGTAAIEGNTLTESEVERRLGGELDLPPSQEYLGREIDNLSRAYGKVSDSIVTDHRSFLTEADIKAFNRIVLDGLPLAPDVIPGEYAQAQHGVARYRAPSPTAIRRLMPVLVEWLADDHWNTDVASPFAIPVLKAILAHLYVAWIHPFGDGNGRTARLVEADLLARCGVPEISYHLLSTHYNQTRTEYYRVLAHTSATPEGDPLPFIHYALQGLVDGLRMQVEEVKKQHKLVVWRDFVYDHFRDVDPRRRDRLTRLAIDLAGKSRPVPRSHLAEITPRVLTQYAGRTPKTMTRDIRELTTAQLIRKVEGGYVANMERIEAFVPVARKRAFRSDSLDQILRGRSGRRSTGNKSPKAD